MVNVSEDLSLYGIITERSTVKVCEMRPTGFLSHARVEDKLAEIEIVPSSAVSCICFVGSSKLLIATAEGNIDCWDVQTATKLSSLPLPTENEVAIEMVNGQYGVAVITSSSSVILFVQVSSIDGDLSFSESIKADSGSILFISYRKNMLATCSKKRVRLWDLSSKTNLSTIALTTPLSGLAWSKDASQLLAYSPSAVYNFQVDQFSLIHEVPEIASAAWTDSGAIAVVTNSRKLILTPDLTALPAREVVGVRGDLLILSSESGKLSLAPLAGQAACPLAAVTALLTQVKFEGEYKRLYLETVEETVYGLGAARIPNQREFRRIRRMLGEAPQVAKIINEIAKKRTELVPRVDCLGKLDGKLSMVLAALPGKVEEEVEEEAAKSEGESMSTEERSDSESEDSESSD